ncbi:hypothetical protein PP740_gp038 [Stenotrophomonas phage Philippe]|uniref:Uncharacterized protein n=1 Tax=Stenotrophomonas phage Philippe TaxID=2859655 RepID=A0AAE7WMU7_9CAUD|nr:hypothetical protein PP740_gp038 [Stenotrophomonas phage Philippe]QYW02237.1 hypothetical protein CPT_Philippe_038 [Stenotrophomonas phage Philippe]
MQVYRGGDLEIEWPETKEEWDQHHAGVMLNDPKDLARAWIIAYADQLTAQSAEADQDTVTIGDLMRAALSHVDGTEHWGDYISRGGAFEGQGTDPLFWEHFRTLVKGEYNQDNENNFFSCSC